MKSSPLTSFVRDDLHQSKLSSQASPLDEAVLRKRIGELQQYRKLGLTTAADIKKWEDDLFKRVRFAYLTPPCFIFTTHGELLDSGKSKYVPGPLFVGATAATPGRQCTPVTWTRRITAERRC